MQFDREKLKALVLYACSKCHPSDLGAVKLHKVLYFTDMIAYATKGSPVTGAVYRKRPHGPTCDALLGVLSEMQGAGQLAIESENFYGYYKKVFLPLSAPDTSRFAPDELKLIDDVVEFVCKNNSARTISEFSHNRAWDMAEFGEELPYTSAFYMFPTQASKEALDWAGDEAQTIEPERSKADPVGLEDYAAFRSRVRSSVL